MKKLDKDEVRDILALTPLQEGMLFHYLKDPGNDYYFEQLSLEISGEIDVKIFEKAWNLVIETNEMLRVVFRWEKLEKPSQIILKEHQVNVVFYDWPDKNSSQRKTALEEIKDKDRRETFDLHQVPFRIMLCRLEKKKYVVVISNHHILYDGWSNGIILKEFFIAYHELCQGGRRQILPVKSPFKEFIKGVQSQDRNKQEQFWRDYLAGVETPTVLPLKRRKAKTTRAEDYSVILEEEIRVKLDVFVKNHHVTLAPVFYTAWGILLQRYCNSEDVVFGTTVSGRSAGIKGMEDMVGLLINTIPLRVQAAPGVKMIDIVSGVENLLQVREEFENTPLVDIGSYSPLGGSVSLFDTLVVLENYPLDSRLLPENSSLSIDSYAMVETSHYDLTVAIMPFNELEIKFSYRQELFAKLTIENVAGHFIGILRNIVENPEAELSQLEIISSEEKSRLLYDFNNTAAEYPTYKTLHGLFAEQVEGTPDRIALVGPARRGCPAPGQSQITYRQLNEQSNRLASLLLEKGILPGTIAAIMIDRSIEMPIGIFGILKSGGAYLPIDPNSPQERTDFMLNDSGAKLLVTAANLVKEGEKVSRWEGETYFIEESSYSSSTLTCSPSYLQNAANLAYIIYTSGTTGEPKGVLVEHRSLVNLIFSRKKRYHIDSNDRVMQFYSICFDASAEQIFTTLSSGALLVLIDKDTLLDSEKFASLLIRQSISHFDVVPSFLSQMRLTKHYPFKRLVVGGEVCPVKLAKKWSKIYQFYNVYGPTETTVTSLEYLVKDTHENRTRLPVGKPIDNTIVYLLDKGMKLAPPGIAGEIYIGGAGVARGYLNQPELTFDKFKIINGSGTLRAYLNAFAAAANHHSPITKKSARRAPSLTRTTNTNTLYKTGDLARWLDDGNIEFMARIDQQVKIRGFRIELGEIRNLLLKLEAIKDAVVTARAAIEESEGSKGGEVGEKFLCAYIVSDEELEVVELTEYLLRWLPDYMVPSYFIKMEKIPLTSNGKIDRRALPVPGLKVGKSYTAPRNEIEKKLVEIWKDLLNPSPESELRIGIDDHFFEGGGHSLKATLLVSRLERAFNVKIPLSEIFRNPRIRELAGSIKEAVSRKYEQVELVEKKEYYALSSAQQRLYFLRQMDIDGTTYNISGAWLLEGILDKPRLVQSIRALIRRHESLRTSIEPMEAGPVQRIHEGVEFQVEHYKIQKPGKKESIPTAQYSDPKSQELRAKSFIKNFIRPFDLSRAPLLRVGLVKLEAQKHLFLVDMHHIISDGMSTQVLVQDFSALFAGQELPGIKVRYKDYAEGQHRDRVGKKILEQGEYWKKEDEGDIPVLDLPTDYARPAVRDFAGNNINFEINRETSGALKALALDSGATLYIVLLALYAILLAKLGSQEDIVIGSPVAGRKHADLENIIGMFVNTLAFRSFPAGEKGFREFLGEVKETALNGFENQEYQYEDLVEQIPVKRDPSRNPLFDTMFVLQNTGPQEIGIPGLKVIPYEYPNPTAKFDLTLTAVEVEGKLHLTFEYSTTLFKPKTIEGFIVYFKNLVKSVVENKNQRISDLQILTEEEKYRVLCEFNDTLREYPREKTIQRLFAEQVEQRPSPVALVGPKSQTHITYRELHEQSDRLAQGLREKGVKPDTIVAIRVERSIQMIVGMIGILKSGGAYLPIDPDYPQERINYMLKDSSARLLVTTKNKEGEKVGRWEGEKNLEIIFLNTLSSSSRLTSDLPNFPTSQLPNFHLLPATDHRQPVTSLAYIIYTSGTTGQPKGSLIEHRNVVRLLFNDKFPFDFSDRDVWTLFHSYCFDFSVWEMYGALLYGGKLIIVPKMMTRDAVEFPGLLTREAVTVLNQTPSAFYNLLNEDLPPQRQENNLYIKYVIFGGEALKPLKLKPWLVKYPRTRFINMFGITETTVHVTYKEIKETDMELNTGSIGKPIPTSSTYILDNYLKPVPVGVAGEIWVGGDGVARGYLNQVELTAGKFIENPYKPGDRLYRSGDTGRFLENGEMEYLGRIDNQVKIRGFRIELGEIENRLLSHEGIKESVVICGNTARGDQYLCAYIVGDYDIPAAELRACLLKQLPDYMVPAHFVRLGKIPLTPNGKIDRGSLPVPGFKMGERYTAPRDEIETKLVKIWKDLLKPSPESDLRIGIDDHFFEWGGHSLKATLLASRIEKAFNVKIPLPKIFMNPRIRELAVHIKAAGRWKYEQVEVVEKKEYYALSSAQQRLFVLNHLDLESTAYNMPEVIPLAAGFDPGKIAEAFKKLIKRHESLRTSFHMVNDRPVQKIHDDVKFEIEYYKVEAGPHSTGEIIKNVIRVFDLSRAPLLRVKVVQVRPDARCILLVDMPHIISDGVSWRILAADFAALTGGKELPTPRLQYKDYVKWLNSPRQQAVVAKQETYWLHLFEGEIPVLSLPLDYSRPQIQRFEGSTVGFIISNEDTQQLIELALKKDVTLYMVLHAIYDVFLFKVTGQEDMVIGTGSAGRRHHDLQDITGIFVNTLAIRNFPQPGQSFVRFLKEVKHTTLEVFENQEYPFEELVEKVNPGKDTSRNPLFDTMLVLQNMEPPGNTPRPPANDTVETTTPAGLTIRDHGHRHTISKFDMTLFVSEVKGELHCFFEYSTRLFKPGTIGQFIHYFKEVAANATADPGQSLKEITRVSRERKEMIIRQLNRELQQEAAVFTGPGMTLQRKLKQRSRKFSSQVAIEYGEQIVTYNELSRRAGKITRAIIDKGIPGPACVGILLEDRAEVIAVMVGILNAGCVFVPLDPSYPRRRLDTMIRAAGIRLMVTDSVNSGLWDEPVEPILIRHLLSSRAVTPKISLTKTAPGREDRIYIYFTSGTTGTPRAMIGKNGSLLHFINWEIETFGINEGSRFSQFITPVFDAFLRDIFVPLLSGGVTCIPQPNETLLQSSSLIRWLERCRIHLIHCVPALFRLLVPGRHQGHQEHQESGERDAGSKFKELKYILLSGERINPGDLSGWYEVFKERIRLVNLWGTSETTLAKTYYFIQPADLFRERVPVGKPLPGARVVVLDENLEICDPLVKGQLYIKTPFRTLGYQNEPALNRERFIPDPFSHDTRVLLHQTGDRGRMLIDGTIDVMGRNDRQVKIRGIRVELEEIETVLSRHERVKEAVVLKREISAANELLCAYITLRGAPGVPGTGMGDTGGTGGTGAIAQEEYRRFLSERLPGYMVPGKLIILERMPRKPNGKVDYEALPDPLAMAPGFQPPRDAVEEKLLESLSEILKRESASISVTDSFFELGGNSLNIMTFIARIHRDFDIRIPMAEVFRNPIIEKQAAIIRARMALELPSEDLYFAIKPIEDKEYHILSSAQQRLYVLKHLDLESTAYNMTEILPLAVEFDLGKIAETFKKLIKRHESLRTSFHLVNDMPVQRIHDSAEFEIGCYEVEEGPHSTGEIFKNFIRTFDLSQAPLLRVGLVKLAAETHLLLVDMHHIISDGMSTQVLVQDFSALYRGKELPGIKVRYKDYAEGQNRERVSKKVLEQAEYWKKKYEGEIPVLDLPTDFTRPVVRDYSGNSINFQLNSKNSAALKALALESGATPYIVLLALYYIFLAKLSSREDIVIGTPVAGRRHTDLEKIIGMFVNTLAFRNYPAGEKGFGEFLGEVKETALNGFENQEYQYEDLVEQISVNRDASRNPLFDTMFVLQNTGSEELEIPGLKGIPYEYPNKTAKFDLALTVVEVEEKLQLTFAYGTTLFKQETIERFIVNFKNLVQSVVENQNQRISDLEILTEEEKNRVLFEFNNTEAEYPKDKSIQRLFAEQAEQRPNQVALVGPKSQIPNPKSQTHITYCELHEQSDRLARLLIKKGVLPGDIIGLMMERSIDQVSGILGILKAGAAYLPIDREYPKDRIDFMLKDSGAGVLITSPVLSGKHENLKIVNRQWSIVNYQRQINRTSVTKKSRLHLAPWVNEPAPGTSLAYIIYTSGSTGRPKGVMIDHQSVARLVKHSNFISLSEGERLMMTGSAAFDISTFETWGPLLNGLTLFLANQGVILDAGKMGEFLETHRISILHLIPQLLNQFVSQGLEIFRGLKYFLVGGDLVRPGAVNRLREKYPGLTILHMYGPSENTTFSTYFPVERAYEHRLPIGKPIANSVIYILDPRGGLVPLGVVGELWVGGDGLARGYLNKPELTGERFDHDLWDYHDKTLLRGGPDAPRGGFLEKSPPGRRRQKIYKTGDLGRWLPEGNIEFFGRNDSQVKIRGFRIELAEIENQILRHEKIRAAAVVMNEPAQALYAYVVPENTGALNETALSKQLNTFLSHTLPSYMVPHQFVLIDKIPLTPHGKVDKQALPEPGYQTGEEYAAPQNPLEKKLVEIWSGILGLEESLIGTGTDFFELGGHSLRAFTLVGAIHKALEIKIPLAEIFQKPTIRGLAHYIEAADIAGKERFIAIPQVEEKEYYPLSASQRQFYILQYAEKESTAYNVQSALWLEGKPDREQLEKTFLALIRRHEILRTSFPVVNREPVQVISGEVKFKIEYHDAGSTAFGPEPEEDGFTRIINNFIRPFDLVEAPQFRVGLIKVAQEKHIFLVDMHHIVTDGTSMAILVREFDYLYSTGLEGKLPLLKLRYRDFSQGQQREKQEDTLKHQQEWWLKELTPPDRIPVLNLPLDYRHSGPQTFQGSRVGFTIAEESTARLNRLATRENVTLFMALLAICNVWLSKVCRQEEIVVGSPVVVRPHADLASVIGLFLNTLVLRNYPSGQKTFREFLHQVKERTLNAFHHKDYPYEELVSQLSSGRNSQRGSLFDFLFVLQNTGPVNGFASGPGCEGEYENPYLPGAPPGLTFKPYRVEATHSPFDMVFLVFEKKEKLDCSIYYRTALFKPETIYRIIDNFKEIFAAVLQDEGILLKEIAISHDWLAASPGDLLEDEGDFGF